MTNGFGLNNSHQLQDIGNNATMMPSPPSASHQDARAPTSSHGGNVTIYHTTGPDAYASPILSPGSNGTPVLNPRSCVTCRRRKVRCDKQMPCSNCRRAQIPCIFPAPGRAPRQPRPKDPNAPSKTSHREVELIKRLKKLEGIVEELSGQIDEPAGRPSSIWGSPTIPSGTEPSSHRQLSGAFDQVLAQEGSPHGTDSSAGYSGGERKERQPNFGRIVSDDHKGTSRYISSGFWSKLNDELDAIREETQRITDEDDDDSDYDETLTDSPSTGSGNIADHHGFILGYRSSDVDLQKCRPSPSHATFLWSVYQENVEPLIKTLHVPSVESIMREARKNSGRLSAGHEALLFAIYFAAITSLEPDEVQTNFGTKKDDMIAQYRFAVEQALAKANFLETSDLAVIQAFTIFLVVVRRYDDSRFCWTLTGLVIRLAQGMGLHRDGTHLKLSPFETEIRRRVWWSILVLDYRSADELGTDMMMNERTYDTLQPSNINDSDIKPEDTEFPTPRDGKSDCAVSVIRCEIGAMARKFNSAASAMSSLCPGADQVSVADRERMLMEMHRRVEDKFLHHVNEETDGLYWVAIMIARVVVAKMSLVIYQPMLFPGSEFELPDETRQRIYIAAIQVLEYSYKLNTDPRSKQYRWLLKTYTNWHAIAYVLIETCRRPWTALVERGWQAINLSDIDPLELAKKADHAAVFFPLRKLLMKAKRHRESEFIRLRANQDEAHRLDFAERMNQAQAQFGPFPGSENQMEAMREQWWALVRGGTNPAPYATGQLNMSQDPSSPNQTVGDSQKALQSSGVGVPSNLNISNAAMEYMNNIMTGPNNAGIDSISDIWSINSLALDSTRSNTNNIKKVDATTLPQVSVPGIFPSDDALRQQTLTMQTQPPKDNTSAPFLWTDPFTAMYNSFGSPNDDTDMLGDDFDWQDWSQNIKGLGLEQAHAQGGW